MVFFVHLISFASRVATTESVILRRSPHFGGIDARLASLWSETRNFVTEISGGEPEYGTQLDSLSIFNDVCFVTFQSEREGPQRGDPSVQNVDLET